MGVVVAVHVCTHWYSKLLVFCLCFSPHDLYVVVSWGFAIFSLMTDWMGMVSLLVTYAYSRNYLEMFAIFRGSPSVSILRALYVVEAHAMLTLSQLGLLFPFPQQYLLKRSSTFTKYEICQLSLLNTILCHIFRIFVSYI